MERPTKDLIPNLLIFIHLFEGGDVRNCVSHTQENERAIGGAEDTHWSYSNPQGLPGHGSASHYMYVY